MTKRKRNDDHVRINSRTSTMNCEHCGASEPLALPLSFDRVKKITGDFLRKHRKCPPPELKGLTPHAVVVDEAAKPSIAMFRNVVRVTYTEPDAPQGDPANWERFKASVRSAARVRKQLEADESEARTMDARIVPQKPDPVVDRFVADLRKLPALPKSSPCGSCPYRRDVPAGVWAPEEYSKLPRYDAETFAQPIAPFFCHAQDGTVCAGWLGCHGADQLLAVRLGVSTGRLDPSCLDASTDVPLFGNGAEAAAHGASGVKRPSTAARQVIRKLERARRVRKPKPG